jgi:hypothetical protein
MNKGKRGFIALEIMLLLVVFSLAGCDWLAGLFNPLIGSWSGTFTPTASSPVAETMEYKADDTFTATMPGMSITFSGTYVQDSDAKTATITVTTTNDPVFLPVGYVETFSYSFSSDNDTMTIVTANGSGTFTRQ